MEEERRDRAYRWTEQGGQIHLLLLAPLFAVLFLSLLVHTASSAIDPALEKHRVTEQLKRRLEEMQHEAPLPLGRLEGRSATALVTPAGHERREEATGARSTPRVCPADRLPEEEGPARGCFGPPALPTGAVGVRSVAVEPSAAPRFPPTRATREAQYFRRLFCPPPRGDEPAQSGQRSRLEFPSANHSAPKGSPGGGEELLAERVVELTMAFEHGEGRPTEA